MEDGVVDLALERLVGLSAQVEEDAVVRNDVLGLSPSDAGVGGFATCYLGTEEVYADVHLTTSIINECPKV